MTIGQSWETTALGSLVFLHILGAEDQAVFVLGYLFEDVCIANSPGGQKQCLPQEQKAASLSNIVKITSPCRSKERQARCALYKLWVS